MIKNGVHIKETWVLEYTNGISTVEVFTMPNERLCYWKRNTLVASGTHTLSRFKKPRRK
jgi:hypothetical protein